MTIEIRCRRPGFRRAGIAHPAVARYPEGRFSAEQMAALRAEPLIEVREIPDPEPGPGSDPAVTERPARRKR
ncbi:hypothetical protein KBD49_13240 [Myxococcota bacterium]|jgi:hypothetical protein|nr:hypothetical protein [Myxococcota bacterium]